MRIHRSIGILTAASLVSSFVPHALATTGCEDIGPSPFSDVGGCSTYFDAIYTLQGEEIIHGNPDGTYRPESPINRAEFAKLVIASRHSQQEIDGCLGTMTAAETFSDVPRNAWYAPYICMGKRSGFIGGYPDGTYKPAQSVNVAEALKILAGAYELPVKPAGEGQLWYQPHADAMRDRDAIPPTVHFYNSQLLRNEMAEMLFRLRQGNPSSTFSGYLPRMYADPQKRFSFDYRDDLFVLGPTTLQWPFGSRPLVNARGLFHAVPVEHCGESGLPEHCRPTTHDSAIVFGVVPLSIATLREQAKDLSPEVMSVMGTAGWTFTWGVEGEYEQFVLVPLNDWNTLVLRRSMINEEFLFGYKNVEGWIPFREQARLFAYLLATLHRGIDQLSVHDGSATLLNLTFEAAGSVCGDELVTKGIVITKTPTVADLAMRLLLSGPDPAWTDVHGTAYVEPLSGQGGPLLQYYNGVVISGGIATVDFDEEALAYLNSAACMQGSVKFPIEATLKHFPTVKEVRYSINGKVFDEWDA